MKKDKNICIRAGRDDKQITDATNYLQGKQGVIENHSSALNLLGNSVRLSITVLLLKESKLCVCDLSEILKMKIPAVSQHLRKLKDGGLLSSKRDGTILFYSVAEEFRDYMNSMVHTGIPK